MSRMLTSSEIMIVARRGGAKRMAVENFLMSADNTMPLELHVANMERDAKSYGWDSATRDAIRAGLNMMYKGE